jgi:low temperature requirement protein LtrA
VREPTGPRCQTSAVTDSGPSEAVTALPAPSPPTTAEGLDEERRTSPLELLWDLVFVFAVTQVTTLLTNDLSWAGFGRSMLVLALIWWAWSAFVWAANAQSTNAPAMRLCLLLATVFVMVSGLAVPEAFSGRGTLFAVTYTVVRFLHLVLYADASRKGNASWSAIAGFGTTVLIGMALLIGGSFLDGTARAIFWFVAVAIDYAGPAWLTRERLRGLQRVAVAHFAERYSLFVIICLGESIVTIGVGARGEKLDTALMAAVSLGLMITIGLWWTYFDRFAQAAEARLREHDDPVLAAADAYSYLHLVIVAGIIIFAVGINHMIHAVDKPLHAAARLAMCGGVALYLMGHVGFRLRIVGEFGAEKTIVAAALMLWFAVGGGIAAWALAGGIALMLGVLCAVETTTDQRRRTRGEPRRAGTTGAVRDRPGAVSPPPTPGNHQA